MKILLFGGSGQLGFELSKRAADLNFSLVSPVTKEVDITDSKQVHTLIERLRPDLVINSAAYTAVDKAEEEVERAFLVNAEGAKNVSQGCERFKVRLIHISTDYVFDGSLGRPLREEDDVKALGAYGRSKLLGEQYVQNALGDSSLIVRTQALYGQKGTNFVLTMLKLFTEREELKVVDDQFVSPTWAGWLAEVLLDLARLPVAGVVHASCSGVVSWFDFAVEIQRLAAPALIAKMNGKSNLARLEKTSAFEFNRAAPRPVFSAFDTARLEAILRRPVLAWGDGLRLFLREIGML